MCESVGEGGIVIDEPSYETSVGEGDGGTSNGLRGRVEARLGDSRPLFASGSCSLTFWTLLVLSAIIAMEGI